MSLTSDVSACDAMLADHHYLGPCRRGRLAWIDEHGCIVLARPSSRNVARNWMELSRWCLIDGRGSEQWAALVSYIRRTPGRWPTTIVSYSDPAQGHTGALYRACNWLWAPTWHRLRPPPSGNGAWTADRAQGVKDRWIYPLCQDAARSEALSVKDASLRRTMPWAEYREPKWHGHRFRPHTGGGDYRRFVGFPMLAEAAE